MGSLLALSTDLRLCGLSGYNGHVFEREPMAFFELLKRYRDLGCLMGCSIQPDPTTKSVQPEAAAGDGESAYCVGYECVCVCVCAASACV